MGKEVKIRQGWVDVDEIVTPGTFAPVDADYVVATANGTLTAERVVTDTATITKDVGTAAQLKLNLVVPVAVASGGTGQTTEAEAVGELIQALTEDTSPDIAADFIATYDASADTGAKVLLQTLAEKLCESGSWTPAFAFGGAATGTTYDYQEGRYNRIGRLVVAWGCMILTSNGSSTGDVTITGLPFVSADDATVYSGAVGTAFNIATGGGGDGAGNTLAIVLEPDSEVITVLVCEGDGQDDYLDLNQGDSTIADDAGLFFTIMYQTDDY